MYRDETPLDPNKEYTAEELAKFIREKIYGVDTRDAMAQSLLKANEVSEWSREVAQQLIDGSFDEGELNTEIERKLNELEVEYAPRLNSLDQQLAETTKQVNNKVNEDYFNNRLAQLGTMSPKGAFLTLDELQDKHPDGAEGIYIVDNYWYFWGDEWVEGGEYRPKPLSNYMFVKNERWEA